MSVSTTHNRNDYVGNGTQTTFAYTFKVFAASDLEVYLDGAKKTLNTDYTVTGAGNPTGGNVVFVTAPGSGVKVAIIRAVPFDQQAVFVDNDRFPASTINDALDKLTMLAQQLTEKIGRALTLATASTQTNKTLDDLVAFKHLRVKADASGIEMADAPTGTVSFPITTQQGGLGTDVSVSAAEGDLLVRNAALVFARLAKAARGAILRTTATTVSWLAKGSRGAVLRAGADDPEYTAAPPGKGALLVPDSNLDPEWIAVGLDRALLEADSTQARGVAWVTRALGLKSVQIFTTSGTWTRPTGIRRIVVEVVGGGGAGGGVGVTGAGEGAGGGGGGGGGYALRLIDVTGIASATVTVGAGGSPNAGADGGNGGTSSWSGGAFTVQATGGLGGDGMGAITVSAVQGGAAGGLGGSGSGGNFQCAGQTGAPAQIVVTASAHGGIGGTSGAGYGPGGRDGSSANGSAPATGFGGGGGGASNAQNQGLARSGGAGAQGVVIVWEYE